MLPFKLVYSEKYFLPIGDHVFRADKYRLIRERLFDLGAVDDSDFLEPLPASESDVMLVHSPHYVNKLMEGSLSAREELQMEIPYSPQVVDTFMLHAGGSILAAERALADGVCVNIGGGFHHAFPDHGEGFCMLHDFAIAIRTLQKRKLIQRAMTVDCDVHQGNGTAYIFGHAGHNAAKLPSWPAPELGVSHLGGNVRQGPSKDVFTISLHQENNYPMEKLPSSIDVNLRDGCSDAEYLAWLDNALSSGLRQFEPDLICYVAGADPFREDQLGGLDLSIDGLKRRDELLFRAARARSIPVFVTFAGGYAIRVEDTVTIHTNTILAAAEIFRPAPATS
ncbi:MAG TPA: histone deacetylase [Candidatus Eisenbacteria bacterium]|nr:histone deacetylase [Candidatus Eisenbacteria bacterium]